MKKQVINPRQWQNNFGFVQANDLSGVNRMLVCSGQVSVDENGAPVHAGNMSDQITKVLDNLETVLTEAGLELSDVVRLNCYTTDVPALLDSWGVLVQRLADSGCQTTITLLGVAALFHPDILIEMEATVIK
jgi:enamine deaminase RidA (YjgF/YER057c/UK114 family)